MDIEMRIDIVNTVLLVTCFLCTTGALNAERKMMLEETPVLEPSSRGGAPMTQTNGADRMTPGDPAHRAALARKRSMTRAARAVADLFASWNRTNSPGAAVVVVHRGSVVLRRGFGMADVEAGIPITPATVFDAASLAKQFTGFAIATLIEQHRMAPDDKVREFLPEVPDFGPAITIRHLLHHTSGLRDWGSGAYPENPPHPLTLTTSGIVEMVSREKALDFAPGTRHQYCNTGYNLLAAVVERVTREPLRAWMERTVFKPLSMNSTQLRDTPDAPVVDLAALYQADPSGAFVKQPPPGPAPIGSSSLYTSADDLAKWLLYLGTASAGETAVFARVQEPDALNNGTPVPYGFGLCLGEIRGTKMISHAGAFGYTSSFCYVPADRLGVVVLSNTGAPEVWSMATKIAALWLAGPE